MFTFHWGREISGKTFSDTFWLYQNLVFEQRLGNQLAWGPILLQPLHLLNLPSHMTSLNLTFLICKMRQP